MSADVLAGVLVDWRVSYPEGHPNVIKKVEEGRVLSESELTRTVSMEDGVYVCSDAVRLASVDTQPCVPKPPAFIPYAYLFPGVHPALLDRFLLQLYFLRAG